jgi:putative ABC transport system ATP-binding protein
MGRMNDTQLLAPPVPPATHRPAAARAVAAVKRYGSGDTAVTALDSIDVDIPAGRFTAVMGPSGSGKSTLMHCLAGLDTLTSGQVFLGDVDLNRLSDRQLTKVRREQIGFIFQSFNLIPTLTAIENITLPLTLGGREADQAWLEHVVGTVGLRSRLAHRPSELSGGQQQRVAVARALVSAPRVILADEPTGNLDSANGDAVMNMLTGVAKGGTTIIMVTHSDQHAARADRVINMLDGRFVDGTEQ